MGCLKWGCIRYSSIVSILLTADGVSMPPSMEKHRGASAQKLSNVLLWTEKNKQKQNKTKKTSISL